MLRTPHKWVDGELITAEKLNELEEAGLAGSAAALTSLATGADAVAVAAKVNEIIGILTARGVSRAGD